MSCDKLKEIERNLAEQQSFVQSIIEQREKKSRPENNANIDNILSSSIQKAKEKINLLDSKSQPPRPDTLATSRERREKSGAQEGSAIAGAMKKLQERISNLQQQNSRLQSENKELKKRESSLADQTENARRSLQQNKRKVKNLESSIENDKKWIRELQRKNEALQREVLSRKTENNSEQLQRKLTTSEMLYRAQEQQFAQIVSENQSKERKLMELETRRREEQIRYAEELRIASSLSRELELKLASQEEKSKQKDFLIESLKNQIRNLDAERMKHSTIVNNSKMESSDHDFYQDSKASRRKALQTEINKDNEIEQLKEKYEELFITYKNLDQKSRQQKIEVKNYRNKFWQLKQSVKQLIDKIHTLPTGVVSQLKYLIVRINKVEAFSNDYFAATPTKSARKTSLLNNSTERSRSKSKSNSKSKGLGIDLNRSNNSVKSKGSFHTNRSTGSKKSSKSKQKQVIVSTKIVKRSEIAELEGEIQEIRKRYKELVLAQNKESEDVGEDMREELNNLAILLQEKSELLTKLKRKK